MRNKRRMFIAATLSTGLTQYNRAKAAERNIDCITYPVELRDGYKSIPVHLPLNAGPVGAILFLHGSEGSFNATARYRALWLCQRGFVTMAFPYSVGGNQWHAGDIVDVELEHTLQALAWLRKQPYCNGKVGLVGYSRGAEHALLVAVLASKYQPADKPDAVAVHAPTDVIVRDFHAEGIMPNRPTSFREPRNAWRWKGSSAEVATGKPIEVEAYDGPLLVSHGVQDEVWSVDCSRRIEQRLVNAKRHHRAKFIYFQNDKHGLSFDSFNRLMNEYVAFFKQSLS
jgi:dienelactone hydrolase